MYFFENSCFTSEWIMTTIISKTVLRDSVENKLKGFTNLIDVIKHFNNDKVCLEYLEEQRWNGKQVCPHCSSECYIRISTRFKSEDLKDCKDYRCKTCTRKYNALTGTIFQNTKLSLQKWFIAIYKLITSKKGISSLQLSEDLGITQKSAWYMLSKIRETLKTTIDESLQINGIVEVDETYIGGKNKNRHGIKKVKKSQGRSVKTKTPIVGILSRNDKLLTFVVKDTRKDTIQPLINKHVPKSSILITDTFNAYSGLEETYNHITVKHSGRSYKTDKYFHTNSIEGFWSLLKRTITGMYHYISPKHLQRYCAECTFRYNARGLSGVDRFNNALSYCYQSVTYNKLSTCCK